MPRKHLKAAVTTTKKHRGRPNFRRPASPPRWRRRGTTSCWAAARRCAARLEGTLRARRRGRCRSPQDCRCAHRERCQAVNKYAENLVHELRASVTGPQPRSAALTAQHCRLVTCGDTLACAPGQWRCTRTVMEPSGLVRRCATRLSALERSHNF